MFVEKSSMWEYLRFRSILKRRGFKQCEFKSQYYVLHSRGNNFLVCFICSGEGKFFFQITKNQYERMV